MGMGKGAGNLCTELLLEHLNMFYGKEYHISSLLEVIDKVINQLHSENYWGYSVEYYLSSVNHCTPSYARHFYAKHMLSIDQVGDLLAKIDENKKTSFDKEYAESLYRLYNEEKNVDDREAVEKFHNKLQGKIVLLLAPGKTLLTHQEQIKKFMDEQEQIMCMSLNFNMGFDVSYEFITRKEAYEEAVHDGMNIIVNSNVSNEEGENVTVLNYRNWIEVRDTTYDSSGIVALNFLEKCGVKSVYLAGFDGFSLDINHNYFDSSLRISLTAKDVEQRNKFFSTFLKEKIATGMKIEFITPTKYKVI